MRAAMAGLLILGALAGCDDKQLPVVGVDGGPGGPPVPAILVAHDDPPIGSELNHRLVRASRDVAVRLEPRWGGLQPRIMTVAPENAGRVGEELRKAMPSGWRAELMADVAPEGTRLYAFSSGDAFFAALVLDPQGEPAVPVLILRNRSLLDQAKG